MSWQELPVSIHRAVEDVIDGPVVEATSQANGYSPGSADRVRSANGNRAFVKAVSLERNVDTYDLHRRELTVMRMLPGSVSAPRLLGAFEDRDWVALIIEDIDGAHPNETPTESDIAAALSALEAMPVIRGYDAWAGLPDARTELGQAFTGWSNIRDDGQTETLPSSARQHLDATGQRPEDLVRDRSLGAERDHAYLVSAVEQRERVLDKRRRARRERGRELLGSEVADSVGAHLAGAGEFLECAEHLLDASNGPLDFGANHKKDVNRASRHTVRATWPCLPCPTLAPFP